MSVRVVGTGRCATAVAACLALVAAARGGEQVSREAPRRSARAAVQKAFLDAHNTARAGLGLPPLEWSDGLASVAQQWADTLLARGAFQHRPDSSYGENLFEISGARATPADVVGVWVSESRDYDPRTNACRGTCGHYTQVVWRSTRRVGCAAARGRGREIWVCNYDPPGNWQGERPF